MEFNRTKNAKRNTLWGMINKIASLLLPFITRTSIIYVLGSEYLGLSSLFTSILTVLNLSELGIGSAIVFSLYKPIADNDQKTINQLINFYKNAYRIIGAAVLLIGASIIPFLNHLIKSDVPPDINIYILFSIYLFNACVTYWLFAYKNCILHAHQRDDVLSKVNFFTSILLNASQVTFLFLFKNYYVFAIIIPVISIVNNIINALFAKKMFPNIKCAGKLEKNTKKELIKRIYGLSLIKIAAVSRNSFDSIVLSAFLGLTVVAIYNNYYFISSAVASILIVFTTAISSAIGNSVAVESTNKNHEDMRFLNFIYMSVSSLCAIIMLNAYQPFMEIWVGKNLMFNNSIMISFVIYFYFSRIGDVLVQYFDAAGLWLKGRWRGIIEAIVNLIFNIVLCYYFGVIGIVVATIISIVFVNAPLLTFFTFKYYFKNSPKQYILDQFLMLSFTCVACLVSFFVCNYTSNGNSSWIGLFSIITKSFICFFVLFVICFSKTQNYKKAKKFTIERLF